MGTVLTAIACFMTALLSADSGHLLAPTQASIVIPSEEEAMGREFIAAARQQLAFVARCSRRELPVQSVSRESNQTG